MKGLIGTAAVFLGGVQGLAGLVRLGFVLEDGEGN